MYQQQLSQLIQPSIKKIHYRSGNHLFLSFFWKNPLLISGAMFLTILNSLLTILPAIIIGRSLDILEDDGFGSEFVQFASLILLVALLNYVVSVTSNYVFAITAIAYERDIRQEYFDVIQGHSLTFHNENNSSKLLSLGMNEIQMMRTGIMPSLRMILQSFFAVILVLYFMSQIVDLNLVLFTMFGFALYFVFAYRYAKKIGPIRTKLSESLGELTEQSQEIFRGIDVVRSLSAQEREVNRFSSTSTNYANLAKTEGRMSAFYYPGLILLVLTAIVFSITISDVGDGLYSRGQMIEVIGLLLALQFLNFAMPMALLNIRAALTNSGRVWEKMNWYDPMEETIEESNGDINWKGDVCFENVSFSYGDNYGTSLRNINAKIKANNKVALIGGPGSGKSTLLKLLLQLYHPQEGKILIDGYDFSTIPDQIIRNHVSMVEQEVFLFSGTIRENISFAKTNPTEEEIISSAKAAQAFEFIQKMPEGWDTVIGERGITLSGGQRQRIAIARAILANPEILLLDDSSSAIDSKTELMIRKALDNLSEDRLTITVTQRLNTLIRADLIILLDKGEINGMGTHKELYSSNEKYRTIFELLPDSERLYAEQTYSNNKTGGAQ
ncbi:MAG: ABC transporter ATP-binding protein [Candidatus Kariarchaeaceae archaeon]|jgi:ATP-binding cassette subfamily B protein